jgi:hypothetical protein
MATDNASLLSYDDLVGYPVPDGRGGLKTGPARSEMVTWTSTLVIGLDS